MHICSLLNPLPPNQILSNVEIPEHGIHKPLKSGHDLFHQAHHLPFNPSLCFIQLLSILSQVPLD